MTLTCDSEIPSLCMCPRKIFVYTHYHDICVRNIHISTLCNRKKSENGPNIALYLHKRILYSSEAMGNKTHDSAGQH